MGFEYELLHLFAKDKGLALDVKIIKQAASLLDSLQAGAGDIAAANLNILPDQTQKVDFTNPVFTEHHRLIRRKSTGTSTFTPKQLDRKTVIIRKNSSYQVTLADYARQHHISITIKEAADIVTDDQLMEMVANGKIDYTVASENVARPAGIFHKNLDYSIALSEKLPVAWAVNKDAQDLTQALNGWLAKRRGTLEYNLIVKKYTQFSESRKKLLEENFPLAKAGNISPYDAIIKKNASDVNWDWKLVAAQVFQESRFNPAAKSWVGAVGLMQLMPATAKQMGLGVYQLTSPEQNIRAGIKYLQWLENSWQPHIKDREELIKFVLASYNVGMGHVWDARRLAEKYNLNPQKWEGNVEKMLLNITKPQYYKDKVVKYGYCRGEEPVTYVKNILTQYTSYKHFLQQ
jgi:membrane-bound lytic murein transglycosylase F